MKKKRPSRFYDNSEDEFYDAFNPGILSENKYVIYHDCK